MILLTLDRCNLLPEDWQKRWETYAPGLAAKTKIEALGEPTWLGIVNHWKSWSNGGQKAREALRVATNSPKNRPLFPAVRRPDYFKEGADVLCYLPSLANHGQEVVTDQTWLRGTVVPQIGPNQQLSIAEVLFYQRVTTQPRYSDTDGMSGDFDVLSPNIFLREEYRQLQQNVWGSDFAQLLIYASAGYLHYPIKLVESLCPQLKEQ
ncbi:MAG: hypothetical protein A2700_00880 [Candidatus Blackburnbacteria bacterium RIFCSPHIGHO2_01_FULL_44_64]|uniref:Uncharacterized protein n=1 Tax=Candidatus Blackburnbacteria bacterium RIFCSPHIGHO2_02_FULL_44_20 TaxID=1797516 RepID=A0A1G1V655_9BACT|nr:MAG: hypothetical protein A2700_00880 [Candidatus Blackburnbacteria bacterium RIFCSPHIGHO2_01_FULL_44_64]OGY10874.1 MAG: hypothetical protein A3E16_03115 [Candidatus Blackburnbacteria bacterium RIFCSPHIGHO2_12_FULL_44_25]OGY10900.1 MAG: hypothetical protein A3D26_01685 [Candidatus Blackburnbacteria bacterium RIFCSPHIGHO2_02_FULL_44_20]OGY13804.1 MAG: hypothetical protein A3A62_00595 [Candidatus Blackburnbacteria bacterium RIFCSPLOWO2_01_FULL_44_43]OGY15906.1 MAG: hypothetical protein A3H88_0